MKQSSMPVKTNHNYSRVHVSSLNNWKREWYERGSKNIVALILNT